MPLALQSGLAPWQAVGFALAFVLGGVIAYYTSRASAVDIDVLDESEPDEEPTPTHRDPDASDTDRVLAFLGERNGRATQADIAASLDWSARRVDRAVNALEGANAVQRMRLGGGQVVSLTGGENE